jgi:alkaline phosphatase
LLSLHQTGGLSLVDGDLEKGRVKGSFSTYYHSGVSVPVYAAGVRANVFTGVMDNTQLQHKILEVATQKQNK